MWYPILRKLHPGGAFTMLHVTYKYFMLLNSAPLIAYSDNND